MRFSVRSTLVGTSVAAVMISLSAVNSLQAAQCPQAALVQDAADAFQTAARNGSAQGFANATGRFADMRGLALFALGSYRSSLPAGQEAHYVSLAKKFMGRFMADNAGSISGGDIKITSCSDQIINARFSGGTSLVFHLSGGRIADVSVAGFSIAQAMRSKFTGIIRDHNGDVDALLRYLER